MTRDVPHGLIIRPREERDLPALYDLLARQQPASEYPMVWPLPSGTRPFIVRSNELHGWVAEIDGEIVGHIAVTGVDETEGAHLMVDGWRAAHGGAPQDELRQIAVFFTDPAKSGSGIGHHLFATAVDCALREGYPVLDVVADHPGPVNFYIKRGWKIVGEQEAPWAAPRVVIAYIMVLPRKASAVDRDA